MRLVLSLFLVCSISSGFAQKISYEDFVRESKFNKRLMPKQGSTTKTEDQLAAEKAYVDKVMKDHSSNREASNKLVQEGLSQLKEDPKEAMYSFNNAYLLDSSNAQVYFGYGKLYSEFKQYDLAQEFYQQGLIRDGKSINLLHALAENFQLKYEIEELSEFLESSIGLLTRALKVDPEDPETMRLLTKAHMNLGDCEIASDYFEDYTKLAGEKQDMGLKKALDSKCKN